MKKHFFCLIVMLYLPSANHLMQAQTPVSQFDASLSANAVAARQILADASVQYDSGHYTQACKHAQMAWQLLLPSPPSIELANAATLAGKALIQLDSFEQARTLIESAVHTYTLLCPEGSLEQAKAQVALAKAWLELENGDKALSHTEKALVILTSRFGNEHPAFAETCCMLGRIFQSRGQYNQAIPYYETALMHAQQGFGEESSEAARIMTKLGLMRNYLGEHELGIDIIEQALSILKKNNPANADDICNCYLNLGVCNSSLKKHAEALVYYQQALDLHLSRPDKRHSETAYCYSLLGEGCLALNDNAKASEYFLLEKDIMIGMGGEGKVAFGYTSHDIATFHFRNKNFEEAIRWEKEALSLLQGPDVAETQDVAAILLHLGRAQSANGDFAEAIQSFEADHRISKKLFGADCDFLYYADAEMGNTYLRWYLRSGTDSLLNKSRQHFRLAEQGMEAMLLKNTKARKQRKLLIEAVPIYEHAIAAELESIKKNGLTVSALEKAWQLSEAMHSFILFAKTQESSARFFAGIPPEKLLEDSLIRAALTNLEAEKYAFLEDGLHALTDTGLLSLNQKIFALKSKEKELQSYFETYFPEYYKLKYDLKSVTLKQTQTLLAPQQTLIEYFCGDAIIYAFVVKPDTCLVVEIPKDFPLSDWVKSLRDGISGYHASKAKKPELYESRLRKYVDYAHKLHQKLLAPLTPYLTEELIVVPSEALGEIPFDALLSTLPSEIGNLKTYNFLLKRHAIHYAYSATMLQQMIGRKFRNTPTEALLAMAPFYEEDNANRLAVRRNNNSTARRRGITPLPYSGQETAWVYDRFDSHKLLLTGKTASKSAFLEKAPQYQIIHLATHGKCNPTAGEFSYLAFADDTDSSGYQLLSAGELYNCNLNADLVVLSACETGIGEEVRGEGIVSLARAFAYAGAKSVVSTLWSVNDRSTMQVMDRFYFSLKKGRTKNVALSIAKREYLEENPGAMAHPFYWAGFVGTGDMAIIRLP